MYSGHAVTPQLNRLFILMRISFSPKKNKNGMVQVLSALNLSDPKPLLADMPECLSILDHTQHAHMPVNT